MWNYSICDLCRSLNRQKVMSFFFGDLKLHVKNNDYCHHSRLVFFHWMLEQILSFGLVKWFEILFILSKYIWQILGAVCLLCSGEIQIRVVSYNANSVAESCGQRCGIPYIRRAATAQHILTDFPKIWQRQLPGSRSASRNSTDKGVYLPWPYLLWLPSVSPSFTSQFIIQYIIYIHC